jgi:NAD(P)-dependent dehydrogenase (short-subunit alcohol dehydrogenase family)
MIDEAIAGMGGIDGMVLNVGTFGKTGLRTFDLSEWDHILNTNLRGPMLCCRHGLDRISDEGSIVFVSSVAARMPGSQLVPYDASKAGLLGLSRHIAMEGMLRGIRVNTVMPGLVDTPNGRITTAGRPERAGAVGPFGRQATGWEIGNSIVFMLTDEAAYVHGQILAVGAGPIF